MLRVQGLFRVQGVDLGLGSSAGRIQMSAGMSTPDLVLTAKIKTSYRELYT